MSEDHKKDAFDFVMKKRIAILATVDGDIPEMRVMFVADSDDDFTIWFATGKSSRKVKQIDSNPNVCIVVKSDSESVRIFGKAENVFDDTVKAEKWQDDWSQYFKGKDDPEYSLIKVDSSKVEYWNYEKYGMEAKVVK